MCAPGFSLENRGDALAFSRTTTILWKEQATPKSAALIALRACCCKERQAAPPWENHGGALVSTGMRKPKTAGRGAAGLVKSGNKSNWQRLRIRLRCLIKQRRDARRRLMSARTGHTYQAGDPMTLAATGPRNFRRAGRGTPWQRAKSAARTNLGLRP